MAIPFQFQSSTPQETTPIQLAQAPPQSIDQQLRNTVSVLIWFGMSMVGVILLIQFLRTFLVICNPNEILILSGLKRRDSSGKTHGYRVVTGGRVLRIPILETVKRMDLTTMPVPVEVKNAYSSGGTPLTIQVIANVKIARDPAIVGNAIERFLDRGRLEIIRVARETLEGNLRGVVATLTPEQINEDRLKFAERIAQDVSRDLSKLGLALDILKIQSVSDDVDYLSSIGRRQIANIVRDAEIAESDLIGEAERVEADFERQSEVAQTEAKTTIQQKQNELRKIRAELEQRARSEEERTTAAAKEARARAEQGLQTVRAELERLRLEADEVLPAEAARQAQELEARGEAAQLAENAEGAAQVNEILAQVWRTMGDDAASVFLIQQIEMILGEAARIPSRVHLSNVNVIDNGDGRSIASLTNAHPEMVKQFLSQVEQTLGISVTRSWQTLPTSTNGASKPEPVTSATAPSSPSHDWTDSDQETL